MKRKIVLGLLALMLLTGGVILNSQKNIVCAEEARVYSWDNSALYDGSLYGKTVTVEMKVVDTYNSGKACFLNADKNWKKYFTAVIFESDFSKFPIEPENYYYMKKLRITGTLKE